MKRTTVFCAAMLLVFSVNAQEAQEPGSEREISADEMGMTAMDPKEAIAEATDNCRSWAKADQIEQADLTSYLLSCVNEELKYQGYAPLDSLD